MKLMVMGYGRHGKDTVCELLKEMYGLSFASSSFAAAEYAIYPVLRDLIGYGTLEDCYNDRHNHRTLWYELIKAFNHRDKACLGRLIYRDYDIYAGIRNIEEFKAIDDAGLFDYAIWVDRSKVLPAETTNSCTVHPGLADYILDNNGDLDELRSEIRMMMPRLKVMWGMERNY
ncbi:hypothetical protein [Marinobacter phage PS6]|nr:hypothetical protein [Marinobacter phage PS6]